MVATLDFLPFVGDCGGTVVCHDDCKGTLRLGCLIEAVCNCRGFGLIEGEI